MNDRGKLGSFLAEVIDWNWLEFCNAEKDPKYTGIEAAVFSLIRTCSQGKLGAIRLAIDRVDGKLETPIKIEYPKIWFMYPEATSVAELPQGEAPLALPQSDDVPESPPEAEATEPAVTLTLRQTVAKMADFPREVVPLILGVKREVEIRLAKGEVIEEGDTIDKKIPLVKSVIAANLLNLAIEENNFEAITEVFDQIDGKLVEVIRILSDDVYLAQYALVAPAGATKNKDGIYVIEAKEIAETWKQKLKKD